MDEQDVFSDYPVTSTDEPDEVRDAVASVLAEHRLNLGGRSSEFQAQFNAVRLDDFTATYLCYGTDVALTVDPPTGYHLNFPLAGAVETSFAKETVVARPGRGVIYRPGLEHVQRWTRQTRQICLRFSAPSLELELEKMVGRPCPGTIEFDSVMDLTTPASRSFLATLEMFRRECAHRTGLLRHHLAVHHLEHLLMAGLLLAQTHNYSQALDEPQRAAPSRAVQQAVELMECSPELPLTTAELARRVGLSVRGLQEGFHRCFNISPMAYLREIRLRRVHEDLTLASPTETTVTQIAYRWGFVHLGRFGEAYRRKYGRHPSQTLRSAAR